MQTQRRPHSDSCIHCLRHRLQGFYRCYETSIGWPDSACGTLVQLSSQPSVEQAIGTVEGGPAFCGKARPRAASVRVYGNSRGGGENSGRVTKKARAVSREKTVRQESHTLVRVLELNFKNTVLAPTCLYSYTAPRLVSHLSHEISTGVSSWFATLRDCARCRARSYPTASPHP